MPQGKVKWFNNAKGYGFVIEDGDSEDLFAHFSAIQMEGYKTLKAGERVSFDKEPSAKGIHAVNIVPLDRLASSTGHSSHSGRNSAEPRRPEPQSATGSAGNAQGDSQEGTSGKSPEKDSEGKAQDSPGHSRIHSALSN